ncbi:hypothetical protein Tco_1300343 [Tanacetum coccineum]
MEDVLKRRHVVLPNSEDEDAEISSKQGRNLQEEGLDEMVRNMMKDKSKVFKTPTQGKTSGEEDISLTTLEAAKTLSKVASQRSKSVDKGKRYKRRKESKGKDIDTGFEDISTGFEEVNTGGLGVSTGSGPVSSARGQREGKAPMIVEETQAPKRTKEQIQQEEASLAEAIRLQTLEEEETAKQVHLEAFSVEELKRYGEELQTEISKKQRIDDKDVSDTEEKVGKVKEEEPVKRVGKRKKQKARKGISIDKSPQGDSETDKEESVEAMNPTPLDTKSNIVANWKIFQQDRKYPLSKDVCQVMLKMKLLDGKMNEVCYKLLKMIEKQAGLATPEQTATGKEYSNPLIADDLLKIIWLDAANIKASPQGYGLCSRIIPNIMLTKSSGSYNEDTQRNMKFTGEDQVRRGLLGIIVNRLKSGSYRVKSGRHS